MSTPKTTEWQPIETAPKDGTALLLWEEASIHPFVGWWAMGGWTVSHEHVDAEGGWNGAVVVDRLQLPITHWMPLPPAPGSAPPEQAAQPADVAPRKHQSPGERIDELQRKWPDILSEARQVFDDEFADQQIALPLDVTFGFWDSPFVKVADAAGRHICDVHGAEAAATMVVCLEKLCSPADVELVVEALDWIDDFIARCNGDDRGACEAVNRVRAALAAKGAE